MDGEEPPSRSPPCEKLFGGCLWENRAYDVQRLGERGARSPRGDDSVRDSMPAFATWTGPLLHPKTGAVATETEKFHVPSHSPPYVARKQVSAASFQPVVRMLACVNRLSSY